MNMDVEFERILDVASVASVIENHNYYDGGLILTMTITIENWQKHLNGGIITLEKAKKLLKEYDFLSNLGHLVLDESKYRGREIFERMFGFYFYNIDQMIEQGEITYTIREKYIKLRELKRNIVLAEAIQDLEKVTKLKAEKSKIDKEIRDFQTYINLQLSDKYRQKNNID